MRLPRGSYYKIKTYPDGRRVRFLLTPDDRVVEKVTLGRSKVRRTRTGRKLARRRRRIGL